MSLRCLRRLLLVDSLMWGWVQAPDPDRTDS